MGALRPMADSGASQLWARNVQRLDRSGIGASKSLRPFTAMAIIGILVIGLLTGAVANFLMRGEDSGSLIIAILLGVAGSFLAQYVGSVAGWYQQDEAAGFIASAVGAIVLLVIYRQLFFRNRI